MTKGDYCKLKDIHICNPNFNPEDEADKDFKEDIDRVVRFFNHDTDTVEDLMKYKEEYDAEDM